MLSMYEHFVLFVEMPESRLEASQEGMRDPGGNGQEGCHSRGTEATVDITPL